MLGACFAKLGECFAMLGECFATPPAATGRQYSDAHHPLGARRTSSRISNCYLRVRIINLTTRLARSLIIQLHMSSSSIRFVAVTVPARATFLFSAEHTSG